jgi:hypothetical protein
VGVVAPSIQEAPGASALKNRHRRLGLDRAGSAVPLGRHGWLASRVEPDVRDRRARQRS